MSGNHPVLDLAQLATLPDFLRLETHSLHDARLLCQRFEALAQKRGWQRQTLFAEDGWDLPLYQLGQPSEHSLYLSSGIHGDEPVPPWALLHTASIYAPQLEERGAVLTPLWNPWGLIANTRADQHGKDPNRIFQDRTHPRLQAWYSMLENWQFQTILALHEDYDARGWYAYEIGAQENRLTPALRRALAPILAPDSRTEIEESEAEEGVIWAAETPPEFEQWPEVFPLSLHAQSPDGICITLETPTSAALEVRALAHIETIAVALEVSP